MPKAILSTNNNLDYYFYLPITSYVWNHFGFDTISIIVGQSDYEKTILSYLEKYCNNTLVGIEESSKYKSETLAQCSRLYAPCLEEVDDEYLILGDVDMIPLNSYLYRDFDKLNAYGYDLTGYLQYPMCYVGMYAKHWRTVMNLEKGKFIESMYRDLDLEPKASSVIWEQYWDTDQHILTNRIKNYGEEKFNRVHRGNEPNGLATKRVDRYDWKWDINTEYIDSHLLRNPISFENFNKTYELVQHTLKKDCSWMIDYHKEIHKQYARITN